MDELILVGSVLSSTLRLTAPLLLVALAGLLAELSGVVDLGLEGKMLAAAFAAAGKSADDMAAFDFYSCFPVPVFNAAVDGLGLSADDPRGLTVTGGLPYFGGAGNNYSMHAFATMA
ncbi:MAG: hypothetical protein ACK4F7_10190, partial [Inhella sp.]